MSSLRILVFILGLFMITETRGLTLAQLELIYQASVDLPGCTIMWYGLKPNDVAILSSGRLSQIPLLILNANLGNLKKKYTHLLSSRNVRCVTVILNGFEEDVAYLEGLLSNTRSKKIFWFNLASSELKMQSDSYLKEDIMSVHTLKSGDLLLTTTCSAVPSNSQLTSIWKSRNTHQSSLSLCPSTLKGRSNITIAAFPIPSYTIFQAKSKNKYGGSDFDLVNILAKKIGFQYRVLELPNLCHGRNLVTNKPCGAIGHVINGTAQFGIGALAIYRPDSYTDEYLAIDYSPELYTNEFVMLTPKQKPVTPYINFLRPFTATVWILFQVTMFICSILAFLALRNDRAYKSSVGKIALLMHGTLWGQDLREALMHFKSSLFYFIYGFWIVGIFFHAAAYNCNLRAFIVKVELEKPIDTVNDLLRLNRDLYTPAGTVIIEHFHYSMNEAKREVYARMVERKTIFQITGRTIIPPMVELKMIEEGGARVIGKAKSSFVLMDAEQRFGYQPFRVSKVPLEMAQSVGFVMPLFQPWIEEVDSILQRLVEAGIVDHLIGNYYPRNKYSGNTDGAKREEEELHPYKVEHVAGPLLLLVVGLGLSGVVACIEKVRGYSTAKVLIVANSHRLVIMDSDPIAISDRVQLVQPPVNYTQV